MEELILEAISPEDVELLDLRHEIAQERRQRRLQKIYQTFFSRIITNKQKEVLKTADYIDCVKLSGVRRR